MLTHLRKPTGEMSNVQIKPCVSVNNEIILIYRTANGTRAKTRRRF